MAACWKVLASGVVSASLVLYLSTVYTQTFKLRDPLIEENYADIISTASRNSHSKVNNATRTHKKKRMVWDLRSLPSITHSQFVIKDGHKVFKLGDFIYVIIVIHNHYNKSTNRGGDLVLVWMEGRNSSVMGNVVDHGNGSYTGAVRAMWTGSAVITGAIASSRGGFDFMFYHLKKYGQSRRVHCIFNNRINLTELTVGTPTIPSRGQYCNLTRENYDNQWYCGRPKKSTIKCGDWIGILQVVDMYSDEWLFKNRSDLAMYHKRSLAHAEFHKIDITIKPGLRISLVPKKRCKEILPSQSWVWSRENPIGFFYEGEWFLTHCRLPKLDLHLCFKDKTVVMFGDSTVRQWYNHFRTTLNLKTITNMHGIQIQHNYSVQAIPHGTPLYYGPTSLNHYRPIYDRLKDIPSTSKDIIVIHLYSHFNYHHPSVFTRRLRHTRDSIKRLLSRAPGVKIALKGPHYYTHRRTTLGGMWGKLYEKITRRVFKPLYNKVYYVDGWTMTILQKNTELHPKPFLVEHMVNLFVGYVCS